MTVMDTEGESRLNAYHVGSVLKPGADYRVLSEQTRRLDDEAFLSAVTDVIRAAVDETKFNAIVQQLKLAAETPAIETPKKSVERLAKSFSLTEGEQESVLKHLAEGGDLTKYGALNAVTRASQDVESYDRASELEQVGGQILAMSDAAWSAVVA
jgi:hypothetical protein